MKRVLFALFICASAAGAQERITSYDILVQVNKDASLEITERISVHAEGSQIRRGIYRDFPTTYRDRFGNGVKVALDVKGVEKNGASEPWFTERLSNGVRINTGNDDFLPVPGDYTYSIRYRTTRQLGFFKDNDELYWNAIGTGWIFPIEKGSVEVRLPQAVPIQNMHAEAYTGPQGAQGANYVAEIPQPGIARYRLTAPLAPNEGFTIVLTFPKGLVPAPTSSDKIRWLLRDNRGALIALAGFLLLLAYMYRAWSQVGRDPEKGIIIARYDPPQGQTPAGLRYLEKMGYDMRCFTGDVLALAVAGRLRIHEEDKLFKNEWSLERLHPPTPSPVTLSQEALLVGLFRKGDKLVLKNTNASTVAAARDGQKKILDKEFQPKYFIRNGKRVGIAALIAIATGIAAVAASGGYGIVLIIPVIILMLISLITFGVLIKAPTREGRQLLDEIEGFKLYLSVAERDELKSMKRNQPVLDAVRYESLLPYAVALEVEDAWTSKFTAAAGAAAAAEAANSMIWYSGRGPISNLGDFSRSIGSSLSSTISSASTPPGSSSGSGGGGSSGGGGGGGGGGGR